jgi:hypothetical protein
MPRITEFSIRFPVCHLPSAHFSTKVSRTNGQCNPSFNSMTTSNKLEDNLSIIALPP